MARNPHLDRMRSEIESFNDPREQFIARSNQPSRRGIQQLTGQHADRLDYGYGQMMNPQGPIKNQAGEIVVPAARQTGRWLTDSDALNPDVFEKQVGSSSYPGTARNLAQWINRIGAQGDIGTLESPRQLRDVMSFINEFDPDSIDPMYIDSDMYFDDFTEFTPEMYTSKREQIENEENTFVANLMDRYGRDNPFLQELGGMTTTIHPYGETTEEYTDLGYEYRDPNELAGLMETSTRPVVKQYMGSSIGQGLGMDELMYELDEREIWD